jgi:hypothetical protein
MLTPNNHSTFHIMPLLPASHFSFRSGSTGPTSLPPPGTHLLVTDTLNASADFVIYHLVIEALRSGKPPSTEPPKDVLLVDFSGGRKSAGHWEAIGKKLVSTASPYDQIVLADHITHQSFIRVRQYHSSSPKASRSSLRQVIHSPPRHRQSKHHPRYIPMKTNQHYRMYIAMSPTASPMDRED